jgi:hypothetical protein
MSMLLPMRWLAWLSVFAILAACQSSSTQALPSNPVAMGGTNASDLLVLTASNDLERVSLDAKVLWRTGLGGASQLHFTAHLMAFTSHHRYVVVLVRGPVGEVLTIDLATRAAVHRRQLPAGLIYRGLDVGPVTGRVYVFANRETGPDRGPIQGPPSDAVVLVLTSDLASLVMSQTVRTSSGFDWYIYQGGLDPSETHLLLSYHGPDTTGVDVISVAGDRLQDQCTQPQYGCIRSHGGFVFSGGNILLTTGSSSVLETDQSGQTIREIDTGIENEHIMEMEADRGGRHLLIAGSCLYGRGLFELNLTTFRTDTLDRQGSDVCGERVLVASDSRVAVIDPDVLIIDLTNGRTQNRINALSDSVIDGLAVSP